MTSKMINKIKGESQAEFIGRVVSKAITAGATSGEQVVSFAGEHVGYTDLIAFFSDALLEAYRRMRKREQPG